MMRAVVTSKLSSTAADDATAAMLARAPDSSRRAEEDALETDAEQPDGRSGAGEMCSSFELRRSRV